MSIPLMAFISLQSHSQKLFVSRCFCLFLFLFLFLCMFFFFFSVSIWQISWLSVSVLFLLALFPQIVIVPFHWTEGHITTITVIWQWLWETVVFITHNYNIYVCFAVCFCSCFYFCVWFFLLSLNMTDLLAFCSCFVSFCLHFLFLSRC